MIDQDFARQGGASDSNKERPNSLYFWQSGFIRLLASLFCIYINKYELII
jgi:hypothetical protein